MDAGGQPYPPPERGPLAGQYRGPTRPPLVRSISSTDLEAVQRCKNMVSRDLIDDLPRGGTYFFTSTPSSTLTLPSLEGYPLDCRQFAFDKIVDKVSQKHLEEENVLNWCNSITTLVPLKTVPDGNCLLHSASLGMWGFQDRDLTLRRTLSSALKNHNNMNTLFRRWKYSREIEYRKLDFELDPHQWDEEWEAVVQQASSNLERGSFESLDEFHIFVLANILRRPIIMYAGQKIRSLRGGGTLQEGSLQGVYLPLLWHPNSCKKNPLPLVYNNGHFSTLVVIDSPLQYKEGAFVLPLVDYYGQQLPIKFTLDLPAEDHTLLVMDYLHPVQIQHHGSAAYTSGEHIVCAKLVVAEVHDCFKALLSCFIDACMDEFRYQMGGVRGDGGGGEIRGYDRNIIPGEDGGARDRNTIPGGQGGRGGERENAREVSERPSCINNCGMFGDPKHAYMCSNCFRKSKEAEMGNQMGTNDRQYGNQLGGGDQGGRTQQRNPVEIGGDQRNQSGTSLGTTVKCPKCPEPGYPQFLGMCKRCYENNTGVQHHQEGIYESLPSSQGKSSSTSSPPSVPPPRKENKRSQCRKPGCEFYGTKETRFYCSKCFESDMENILKEVDSGPPRPVSSPPPARDEPGPNRGVDEPPLCRQCNSFYGNDEYSGLCHDCFMKLTISGQPIPSQSSAADLERSRTYTAPQQRKQPGYYNQDRPFDSYHQGKPPPPSHSDEEPHRRIPNTTAPVANLSSRMVENVDSAPPACFLCSGMGVGDSYSYTICAKHAASMSRIIQLNEEGGDEVKVKGKPLDPVGGYGNDVGRYPGGTRGGGGRGYRDARGQEGDMRGYETNTRGQRDDTRGYRDDARGHQGDTRGHQGDTRGHQGDTRGHQGDTKGHQGDTRGHQGDTRGYQGDTKGYQGDTRGHQGDTRGYQGDTKGHQGDTRGYQGDTRGHQGDTRGYQGDTRGGYQGDTRGGYQGNMRGGYQGDTRGDMGEYRDNIGGYQDDARQYIRGNNPNQKRPQGDHSVYPDQKDSNLGYNSPPQDYEQPCIPPSVYNTKPPSSAGAGRDLNGASGRKGDGNGGGEAAAAAGSGGGAAGGLRKKALCATVGCSFKGYPDLHDLCPDCYKEHYKREIDEDIYPLV